MSNALDPKIWNKYKENFDKIGNSKDNIIIIEDFLEERDRNLVFQYLEQYRDDPEFSGGKDIKFTRVVNENRTVYALLHKYNAKIYKEIEKHYCEKYGVPVRRTPWNQLHFVKWKEGMGSGVHADCLHPNGEPVAKSSYYRLNISGLMYPNDNYEGGQINFPEYGIFLKPKAGTLVLFPSTYPHEVTHVTSGVRYTMPIWYTFDVEEKEAPDSADFRDSTALWRNPGEDASDLNTF
jgi:predicted 2-oxoglutarate/Fe(II)-dependent dioxygenase YbiX